MKRYDDRIDNTQTERSKITAAMINNVWIELRNILLDAEIAMDEQDEHQLFKAIKKISGGEQTKILQYDGDYAQYKLGTEYWITRLIDNKKADKKEDETADQMWADRKTLAYKEQV